MLGAAHKPGAIPLRPLTLGDMYDAAFRIIRFNPKATVGSSVLVAAVSMALPVLLTALQIPRLGPGRARTRPDAPLGATRPTAAAATANCFGAAGSGP